MVGVIASLLLAPQSGVLAVDGLAVALANAGKWQHMDSIYSKSWPTKTTPEALVKSATGRSCFLLTGKTVKELKNQGLKFGGDDEGPGERGWLVNDKTIPTENVVWFGSKPVAPSYNIISNTSATYIKAVGDFLKTKGHKKPPIKLHNVIQADLDGNGTKEVLIYAGSRPAKQMYEVYTSFNEGPATEEFSLVMIRSVSGKTVKNTVIDYSGGVKGGVTGHTSFAGLWELDGRPGLEIINRWGGYEAFSGSLGKFAGGKYTKIAESGDGV